MKKLYTLTIAGAAAFLLAAGTYFSSDLQNNIANAEEIEAVPETSTENYAENEINDIDVSAYPEIESEDLYTFTVKNSVIDTETPAKEDIVHMMLNSIDYYDYASGTIAYANPNDLSCAVIVDFQSDIPNSRSYSHTVQKSTEAENVYTAISRSDVNVLTAMPMNENVLTDREVYCDDNNEISLNNIDRTCSQMSDAIITRSNASAIADDKRFKIDEDGIPCYYYRANPTNVDDASICLFPQEMAFGFLLDLDMWDVDGSDEYEGRDCVVLSGKTNEDYGNKIGVDTFTFYVDKQTGALLKYIGYNADGEISDYMLSSGISFNNDFDIGDNFASITNKISEYSNNAPA